MTDHCYRACKPNAGRNGWITWRSSRRNITLPLALHKLANLHRPTCSVAKQNFRCHCMRRRQITNMCKNVFDCHARLLTAMPTWARLLLRGGPLLRRLLGCLSHQSLAATCNGPTHVEDTMRVKTPVAVRWTRLLWCSVLSNARRTDAWAVNADSPDFGVVIF